VGKPIEIRIVRGVPHRQCLHPNHPGERWIPLTQFYHRKTKKGTRPYWCCKPCHNYWRQGRSNPNVGYIPAAKLSFAVTELENRLGRMEAIRRTGVSHTGWYSAFIWKTRKRLRRATAAKILETLKEVRASEEVRHRLDIAHGSAARGKSERRPTYKDFYRPHGDSNLEARKSYLSRNPEYVERQNEAARKRNLTKRAKSDKLARAATGSEVESDGLPD
jgi:hypothetical protein